MEKIYSTSPGKGRYTPSGAALHGLLGLAARLEGELAEAVPRGAGTLLDQLAGGLPRTVAELARDRHVSRQGVQRLANDLGRQGLVERLPNPRHRRAPLLALTERGLNRHRARSTGEAERLNALARGLDPSEIRAAARVLGQLLERAGPPAAARR
jgi:DNA-binding MarR family transcriptional regulator